VRHVGEHLAAQPIRRPQRVIARGQLASHAIEDGGKMGDLVAARKRRRAGPKMKNAATVVPTISTAVPGIDSARPRSRTIMVP
jgi:hypothetical protein